METQENTDKIERVETAVCAEFALCLPLLDDGRLARSTF